MKKINESDDSDAAVFRSVWNFNGNHRDICICKRYSAAEYFGFLTDNILWNDGCDVFIASQGKNKIIAGKAGIKMERRS